MNGPSLDALVQEYVGKLRAYFFAHPRAADTLSGVACFWIEPPPRARREVAALELALEQLVAESFVFKRACLDGRVIYARVGSTMDDSH